MDSRRGYISIEHLPPLAWQVISILSLFSYQLQWHAWRDIIRDCSGSSKLSNEELDSVYRQLGSTGRIAYFVASGVLLQVSAKDVEKARALAAAAYGALDFRLLVRLFRNATKTTYLYSGDINSPLSDSELNTELKYLCDVGLGNSYVEKLYDYIEKYKKLPDCWEKDGTTSFHGERFKDIPEISILRTPYSLTTDLLYGLPIGERLDLFTEAAERTSALLISKLLKPISSLCIWAGRSDLVKRLSIAAEKVGTGEVLWLANGFLNDGWRKLPPHLAEYFEEASEPECMLIALLAAKFSPPPRNLAMSFRDYWAYGRSAPCEMLLSAASTAWRSMATQPKTDKHPGPIVWFADTIFHALSDDSKFSTHYPKAQEALNAAQSAKKSGWLFLAAQMGGLLAQFPETADEAQSLALDAPTDIPLLWRRTEIAKPWDAALADIEAALGELRKSNRKRGKARQSDRRLVATLMVSNINNNDSSPMPDSHLYIAQRLLLSIPKVLKDGTFSTDENACTYRTLKKVLLSKELDLPSSISAALLSWFSATNEPYTYDLDYVSISDNDIPKVLNILIEAGDTATIVIEPSKIHKDNGSEKKRILPMSGLEIRDMELDTTVLQDGALSVKLPPIVFTAKNKAVISMNDDGSVTWWRITDKLMPFVEILAKRGDTTNHSIVFGAESATKVRNLLTEAATYGMPVRGAVSPAGDTASLKHITGGADMVIRFDRREGILHIALLSRPVKELPELLFSPAHGKQEILITKSQTPFILVRDFEAENTAAEKIRAALSAFDSERDGEVGWAVFNEECELPLVDAIQKLVDASDDAIAAEWKIPPSERLSIRSLSDWNIDGEHKAYWWFELKGSFNLDDGAHVTLRELVEALPKRVGGYIPLGGGAWLRLSASIRSRLEAIGAASRIDGSSLKICRAAIPMLDAAFKGSRNPAEAESQDASGDLTLPESIRIAADEIANNLAKPHLQPEGLTAHLRPYQQEGFAWLARLADCGIGSCLADDMGLGKTIQLLAVLLERASNGPSLVVAPASVCGNWCAEAAKFAPSLNVIKAADFTKLPETLSPGDLIVTSYGLLASRIRQFEKIEWNGAILDEAQAIKNAPTKRAEAAKRLKSAWRCVATGTPVENRLSDLWSLFEFLNPGLFGSLEGFRQHISDDKKQPERDLIALARPLILRRVKSEVLSDLPPKTEVTIPVEPDEAERTAYESLRQKYYDSASKKAGTRRIMILAALTHLRRFCCSPSLAMAGAPEIGAKLQALESLLSDLRANGHRALIFSQFTDVLALVRPILERNGWGYGYLDGSTPQKQRQGIVDAFQHGSDPFFLISLKAGGTGLNLTAANYVVLLDPWWNPAVEDQASDRAHRIGQHNPVTVYRLVMKDSIEEKVLELHASKRELSASVLDGTSDAVISEDDLLALLS